MKNIKLYNLYIFISTLTRNIIDIYSVVLLYKNNISIKNIIAIYIITYLIGIIICPLSLKLGNKYGYKYILILSSIITSISFYIINKTMNIYLISLFLSLSIFTYHPIRHYYGINILKKKRDIGNTIIFNYLATFVSSYFAIKKINIFVLIVITLISIIPSIFIKKDNSQVIIYSKKISKSTLNFFILDQTKIIFLLLEPLYLYLVSNNISYVGIFNIIITISSIIYIYGYANNKDIEKDYKFINILFTIILFFKLTTNNNKILLFIAFLEGIGIKTNEIISTMNLYKNKENILGYLIICEMFFCLIRVVILSIIYILNLSIKISLYILLIGIFLLSFSYEEKVVNK